MDGGAVLIVDDSQVIHRFAVSAELGSAWQSAEEALMTSDAVVVTLPRESVMSRYPVRRLGARVMLDLARSGDLEISPERLDEVRADAGPEVAEAAASLAGQLGIIH